MNDQRTLLRALAREGYSITKTGKQHLAIRHPEMDGVVYSGSTPGDVRNLRNLRSLLRRKRRRNQEHQPSPHG